MGPAYTNGPLVNYHVLCFFYFQRDDDDGEEVAVTDLGIVASSANGTEVKTRSIKSILGVL